MSGADAIRGGRDDDVAVAAEYALGLLTPAEARAAEARIAADPPFRALVARWTEDLAALTDAIPAVPPPPGAEAAILRRLFPDAGPAPRPGFLRRLGLWPVLLGAAVAAVLALLLIDPGLLPGPDAPTYQAEIATEDRNLVVTAAYDPDEGVLAIERVAGVVAPDSDQELWLIAGDAAPVSLGVLPDEGPAAVPVPPDLRPALAGGILAISSEAPGGSITGSPGTVLATGVITAL